MKKLFTILFAFLVCSLSAQQVIYNITPSDMTPADHGPQCGLTTNEVSYSGNQMVSLSWTSTGSVQPSSIMLELGHVSSEMFFVDRTIALNSVTDGTGFVGEGFCSPTLYAYSLTGFSSAYVPGGTNTVTIDLTMYSTPVAFGDFLWGTGIIARVVVDYPSCTDPSVPTVTPVDPTVCATYGTTLNISGNLNDADHWAIYEGSCGGTLVGTTTGSTFGVTPGSSTSYFVRGEGGCVSPGSCGSATVNVQNCVPNTKVRNDYCGQTLNYMTQPIYCDWVNGATDYEWEFTDPSNGVHTYIRPNGNQYVRLYYLGLDDLNTEYDVRVRAKVGGIWGDFSTSCTVSSPADYPMAFVSAADCGTTVSSFGEFFECDVTYGADYYEWEFTDPSNNVTTYANTTGNRSMKLSLMGLTANNVEYDVRVRANFGGNWGPYGPSCTITSPAAGLTTKVRTADCGRELTSFTERVFCERIIDAIYYQWELTDPSNNVTVYTRWNGSRNFKLSYTNLTALNTEYEVRVRAYIPGTGWTAYGAVCTLTSPGTAAFAINDEEDVELLSQAKSGMFADEEIVVIDNLAIISELNASAYPNPFKNNITVDFEGNVAEKEIKVYNSLGQVVRSINTSSSTLTLEMDELNQGVYIMQVIAGDEMKTIRLVKQ